MNRTVTRIAMLAAVLATAAPASGKRRYTTPTSAEDFEKLTTALSAEAKAYAAAKNDAAPPPSRVLADVEYSAESARQLKKALAGTYGGGLARMYVVYHLVGPLSRAGNGLLQLVRDDLTGLLALCQYQPMPAWPRSLLQNIQPIKANLPAYARRQREAIRNKALAEKRAAERAVVKHNRMAGALEKTLKGLLIMMADDKADDAALERLGQEVRQKWTTFAITLEAIRSQAVRMKRDRAKKYYDGLLAQARQYGGRREWQDPTQPEYSDTDNSRFKRHKKPFDAEALKVVNLLSTTAREPAVLLPGAKPIKPRPRRPRPRRSRPRRR